MLLEIGHSFYFDGVLKRGNLALSFWAEMEAQESDNCSPRYINLHMPLSGVLGLLR